ncbi:tetratricopeptide repeat protein [Streptomyces sp. H27-C3]|uniref:tetratricopeptide repeat protein n=1 Tax=Streptomyces sp. H27-C3 TaxID=3046305 RepID=UPI0024BB9E62|nr:tetratricopeptide repeat protein [Streptomyces sp. H27-C3]MDJ0461142.1 tetratricopeptide repeat protein [Streptomyces sp. H27-C3]
METDAGAAEAQAPPKGAETKRRTGLRRPAVAVLAGAAVLVAGVAGALTFVAGGGAEGPPPTPGPVGRAMAAVGAVGAGVPASAGDLTALIGDRERWLRKNPGDDSSWAVLGSAYLERGRSRADSADYPRAERALRRSLAARPGASGNLDALVGLAALAQARGDYRGAKKWGETVRAKSPRRWTAYPVLIDAYGRLGDQKAATAAVEKLRGLRSGARVQQLAAQVYRDRGWREDAAATLSDATARAGAPAERVAGLHRLGELAWERGEPEVALRYYESALHTDRGHAGARAGQARALAALGRPGDAEREYRAVLAAAPGAGYALEYGELLESLGRVAEAREQYVLVRAHVALEQRRGVGPDELLLGLLDADHGDPEAAVRRLSAEWKRHPGAEVADALGWALHRDGDGKTALKWARKATDQGVRSALYLYHLGAIERGLGEYGAARRHLEEALRVNPGFSPLLAARAREALNALGEPPSGGPRDVYGDRATGARPVPGAVARKVPGAAKPGGGR